MDYIGWVWFGQMGCFVRWVLNKCKGTYKQFYKETHKDMYVVVDIVLGIGLFFGIMGIWAIYF